MLLRRYKVLMDVGHQLQIVLFSLCTCVSEVSLGILVFVQTQVGAGMSLTGSAGVVVFEYLFIFPLFG